MNWALLVRGRRRPGDEAAVRELLLAPQRLPVVQPVGFRSHPDFRRVRPAERDRVAIDEKIVVITARFRVRALEAGSWIFTGLPRNASTTAPRSLRRRRGRRERPQACRPPDVFGSGPGAVFGQILKQKFDELARECRRRFCPSRSACRAFQNLERIALRAGSAAGSPVSRFSAPRRSGESRVAAGSAFAAVFSRASASWSLTIGSSPSGANARLLADEMDGGFRFGERFLDGDERAAVVGKIRGDVRNDWKPFP